jgi:N-acyl-L-homoserine lactone synthetase
MLVHVVTSANRSSYSEYLPKMFRQRREVFVDWLGWSGMNIVDGMERDEVDDVAGIEYIITLDEFGKLIGSSRFVPSTGPHLLSTVMKDWVERPYERSAKVWEWTRYAPTAARDTPNAKAARGFMLAAVQEWAFAKGCTGLLGISDAANIAFATRMGWKSRPLGVPRGYGDAGELATAIEFSISPESLANTRAFWKIEQPVTYQAPPPISPAPISVAQIGVLDAVCGLAAREYSEALRVLSRLGLDDDESEPAKSENNVTPLPTRPHDAKAPSGP